ncbi:MAG: metallophosphoesterase [Spirochaetales bacterium]|nr:metallophosphoesterase [Spirochaetales bacterium]
MLKIAQISDSHISMDQQYPEFFKAKDQLQRVLEEICRGDYDLIIHTGDVSFPDASEEAYLWVRDELDKTGLPYLITPGNHDDPVLLSGIFNLKDRAPRVILTGAVASKGQSLLFLDSSSERLSIKQASWLKREIESQKDQLILFQHHPPCLCGINVMDTKYPYRTPDFFQKTIADTGRKMLVFAGHYHTEKEVRPDDNLQVYLCPPPIGSISPVADNFETVDTRSAWREIRVENQKMIDTRCHYIE